VDALTRTKPLVPSKLFVATGCKLRYLLETERYDYLRISEGVGALLGRSVHSAVTAIANDEIAPDHDTIRAYIVRQFLTLAATRPTISAILDAIELPCTTDNLVTAARLADCVRAAHEVGGSLKVKKMGRVHPRAAEPTDHRTPPSSGRAFGFEIELESQDVDMAGRADKVELLEDGTIHITDLKTGGALNEAGELRKEYFFQIGAYALVAQKKYPSKRILLTVLAADGTWESSFSYSFQMEIEKAISDISSVIPRGVPLSWQGLAEPGESCTRCQYRASCPAYRSWAPKRWLESGRLAPLDTIGVTESVDSRSDRLIDIRIVDRCGRRVRVLSVPVALFDVVPSVGESVELYELMSSEAGGHGSFPRNFYVANAIRPYASGFSAVARRCV
jgi:hypothetical protein